MIAALIRGPVPERFTATALVTFALVVLKTHVVFERDKKGQWRLKVEKPVADDNLLRPLVQKLLDLAGRR